MRSTFTIFSNGSIIPPGFKFVYVIEGFAVVFGINSTSNAEIIVRGVAEYNLLHYECY